jgi:hypothetical protein
VTANRPDASTAKLTFEVTLSGECIAWHFSMGSKRLSPAVSPGTSLLLVLARKRLADIELGLPADQCGWMALDHLKWRPGDAQAPLNLLVYRMRQMFAGLGYAMPWQVVERRVATNEFRIGTARIDIRVIGGREGT